MSRRWLISISLIAHAGLGVGAYVLGAWRFDRLDFERRATALAVIMPGAPPAEGGHAPEAAAAPLKQNPKKRRLTKDVTQPTPKLPPETVAETSVANTGTEGNGTGEGEGEGTGTGIGDGTPCTSPDCGGSGGDGPPAVCGNGTVELGEACDDGNRAAGDGCSATCASEPPKTVVVAPTVLTGLRLAGDTQIHPPTTVKTQMQRGGRDRVAGTVKLCLDARGSVASVAMIGTTKYSAYDAVLLDKVRTWRYRPYTVNGAAVPACSTVTFQYSMR